MHQEIDGATRVLQRSKHVLMGVSIAKLITTMHNTFFPVYSIIFTQTKTGYKPLNDCLSKRAKNKCKHDFPMERKLSSAHRIICRGNAKHFGVRIKGKRNQLGATMGRRTCEWQSGTSMALAVFARSNSHTAPNYRLVAVSGIHDDEFCSRGCTVTLSLIHI